MNRTPITQAELNKLIEKELSFAPWPHGPEGLIMRKVIRIEPVNGGANWRLAYSAPLRGNLTIEALDRIAPMLEARYDLADEEE
ncbi:MAG: hypothetical protein QOF19_282 [Alphaproteobacteria bacterium]|jgi:hypothetical protein|nr:hypothetical protein [Alphaproteobacteria bacterium]